MANGADSATSVSSLAERMHSTVVCHLMGRNLEGTVGGGDYTLDLLWESTADPGVLTGLPGLEQADRVAYTPLATGSRQPVVQNGIFRTLLFKVLPGAAQTSVQQLERDLLAMPEYMQGIRKWSLGRVTSDSRWTHVWQQEYQTVDDLMGEYLMHPYHWGYVDRYFDPDSPDWLVDPQLAHCYCPLPTSVLQDFENRQKPK